VNEPDALLGTVGQQTAALGMIGKPGVVAVSGGPDSVALLRALVLLRAAATTEPLVVAHLNHQLRGEESNGDERFVHDLYARLAVGDPGLQCRCQAMDVSGLARRQGIGVESAARRARYDWLGDIAHETGAAWVATGHTADDQAETVLHRLLRGAGLRGLVGIPARRRLRPGIDVLRPLLHVRRSQVLVFLEALGQPWREDWSNLDRQYTRNRIRHELLPLLTAGYNPALVDVLGGLAAQADQVRRLVEKLAARLLTRVELPRAGGLVVLDARRLERVPVPLLRELFRLVWRRECWPLREMGFRRWQRVAAVARGELSAADLPGRLHVRRRDRVVLVGLLSTFP